MVIWSVSLISYIMADILIHYIYGVARFFGPVGWKAWGVCTVGGTVGAAVHETVVQCLSPNQATFQNRMRYSSENLAACGGFFNYQNLTYGKNPYQLLNLPVRSFP